MTTQKANNILYLVLLLQSVCLVSVVQAACSPSCGINAVCQADGTCVCSSSSPLGNPVFACHTDAKASCYVIGDPKVNGFGGDNTRINHPCKTTLAHFDTPLGASTSTELSSEPGSLTMASEEHCRVIVDGTNDVTTDDRGEYYVDGVDVYITITKGQVEETAAIRLRRDSYTFDVNGQQFLELNQNDCVAISVNDESIPTCYNANTKMWVVDGAVCGGTEIRFREWNLTATNQPDRPGLSVITNKNNVFTPSTSGFPNSICDYPEGSSNVYKNYYRSNDIDGRHLASLQAFLSWPPIFGQPSTHTHCTAAIDAYRNCPAARRIDAVNICGSLVNDNPTCSVKSDQDVMYVFTLCLNGACSNNQQMCDNVLGLIAPQCPNYPSFDCTA